MGAELGQHHEWNHDTSLDWHLASEPERIALDCFFEELGKLYRSTPALWKHDPEPEGFAWVSADDRENSVYAYQRRNGNDHVVIVMNCTPIPRWDYRVGMPSAGAYEIIFSTDAVRYGGSHVVCPDRVTTEPSPFHGYAQSTTITLPPLGALVLAPAKTPPPAKERSEAEEIALAVASSV
jgi:1,4-alpha-glucan branching enzyme